MRKLTMTSAIVAGIVLIISLLMTGTDAQLGHNSAGREALDKIVDQCEFGDADAVVAAGEVIPLLVQLLRPGSPADMQHNAALSVENLCRQASAPFHVLAALADAGAIHPLVQLLTTGSDDVQSFAVCSLSVLCVKGGVDILKAVSAAGAIAPLVQLLWPAYPDHVHGCAAYALMMLGANDNNNTATMDAAGAIAPLVQLLGSVSPAVAQNAAGTLMMLAQTDSVSKIAAAGAIPPLVRLIAHGTSLLPHRNAVSALSHLAMNGGFVAAIAAAGAIPPLVQLLRPGSSAVVQSSAAVTLGLLSSVNAGTVAAIVAAGAIPLLVQLAGSGHSVQTDVQRNAMGALEDLDLHADAATSAYVQQQMEDLDHQQKEL
jgi:hypothetical protein